jgi:peptide/nickel transport system substrate-binding protein
MPVFDTAMSVMHTARKAAAIGIFVALSAIPALAGKADNSLVWSTDREITVIDNYYQNIRETVVFQWLVWDFLIARDLKTSEYKPLLATSFKWVDNRTIDFELRNDVSFHNGKKFSADDVVYTFNHVSADDSAVMTRSNVDWIESAEKRGDYSVRIHLKRVYPAALEYFASALHIVPAGHYDTAPEIAGADGRKRKDYGAVAPVGTGPYKVGQIVPGKSVTLIRNDAYFVNEAKPKPSIQKIIFKTIPSQETRIAELLTGGIDWLWDVPNDQAEQLVNAPGIRIINAPTMRVSYLQFDALGKSGDKHFMDARVRQAANYAIDRKAIASKIVGGSSQVIQSPCFPTQFGCTEDVARYDYDPAKAKKLLAEAGYPDGFTTDIYAYRDREYTEAVIGYLGKVGIRANLKYLQYKALVELVWKGVPPINQMSWGSSSINDISAITSHFFTGGRDDLSQDAEVAKLLKQGDSSVDPTERKTAYDKALKRIAEQAYWVPMFTYTKNYAFSSELSFEPTPDEIPRLFAARWN